MLRTLGAISVAGGMILLAGCGGSPSKTAAATNPTAKPATTDSTQPTTTSLSLSDLGKAYQAAVAPANDAGTTFQTKWSQLGANPSSAAIGNIADPVVKAFDETDQKLLRLPWPATIKPDVNSLVTADAGLEADLGQASAAADNLFSATAFVQQFTADAGKVHAAVSIVRADLGLPPA